MIANKIRVQTKILDPRLGNEFPMPSYATEGSAGLDLIYCGDDRISLGYGEKAMLGTGMSIFIENPCYAGLIIPKSGLGYKTGLVLANAIGLMDADFQGEYMIAAWNRNQNAYPFKNKDILIRPGDKLAQLIIVPVIHAFFDIVDEFSCETTRGKGGFGSTAKINKN